MAEILLKGAAMTDFAVSLSSSTSRPPTIGVVSLGCPKALVDSERILTRLRAEGYAISPDYDGADLVLVNTCGFLDSARDESLEAIGEAIAENGRVIVTGCLGAEADVIEQAHPSVLAVTGPQQYEQVMSAVHTHLPPRADPFENLVPPQGIKLTPRHYAYVKISEGCNNTCSFCIIPDLRGKLVSRPANAVLYEAERLVDAGVRELLIVSQDTSAYGVDIKYGASRWRDREVRAKFFDLCDALGDLDAWVRLHYVYPYPHVDDVIALMAGGKILPYLDIPFQHASPTVLKAMRRPAKQDRMLERIASWRAACPDLAIRSTFIVGFPGETDADFEELLDFLRVAKIDRAGFFEYENVTGARSQDLANQIPGDVKRERFHAAMAVQDEIAAERSAAQLGKTLDVIIDEVVEGDGAGASPDGDTLIALGRTQADAPDIDGMVRVVDAVGAPNGFVPTHVGDVLRVNVIDANGYELIGKRV